MSPRELLARARQSFAAGEAPESLRDVQHLLQNFPSYGEARLLRALLHERAGRLADALNDAAFVLEVDPLNADSLLLTSRVRERNGDVRQARSLLLRVAEMEPSHPDLGPAFSMGLAAPTMASAALGFAYLRSGWPELAMRQFRAALDADGGRIDLRLALAEALWLTGQYDECRRQCRTVLDHHPECLKATLMMAHMLTEVGRTNHGAELVERAAALDPEHRLAAEMYGRLEFNRMRLPAPPQVPSPAGGRVNGAAWESRPAALAAKTDSQVQPPTAGLEAGVVAEGVTAGGGSAEPAIALLANAEARPAELIGTATVPSPSETEDAPADEVEKAPEPVGDRGQAERFWDPAALVGAGVEQRPPENEAERALALARAGEWDDVAPMLVGLTAADAAEGWEPALREISALPGAPAFVLAALGDLYMRQSRPQLATEAYMRAVKADVRNDAD